MNERYKFRGKRLDNGELKGGSNDNNQKRKSIKKILKK